MSTSRILGPASWACALLLAVLPGCAGSAPRFTAEGDGAAAPPALHQLEGIASYYAEEFQGRTTANGEVFEMNALTAAHRTLPFGTRVRVTNTENDRSVVVRINDRGPFKDERVIDLSLEAAKKLGMLTGGTARVTIEILEFGPTR